MVHHQSRDKQVATNQRRCSFRTILTGVLVLNPFVMPLTHATEARQRGISADAELVANPRQEALQEVLNRCEEAMASSNGIVGTYSHSEFNHTFNVEVPYSGAFRINSLHDFRIVESRTRVAKEKLSQRRDRDGNSYRIEPSSETWGWIRTNQQVHFLGSKGERSTSRDIPEELQRTLMVPVPFCVLVKPTTLTERFNLSQVRSEAGQISILASPRRATTEVQPPKRNFWDVLHSFGSVDTLYPSLPRAADDNTLILITLDKNTFRPIRIRTRSLFWDDEHDYKFDAIIGLTE